MAVEQERGCGFRKVGGLYLCGEGPSMSCDRLPYELKVCPVCGEGIKFSRGWTWIDWYGYAGEHMTPDKMKPPMNLENMCHCYPVCPVCHPAMHTPLLLADKKVYGLVWIGESFYTPQSFIQEALKMGVSRRIAAIPRNLKLGITWVLLAHMEACGTRPNEKGALLRIPGVFYAFRPRKLELLIWKSEATEEKLAELEKKGITPIIIPDGDVDHDPLTSLKPTAEEKSSLLFKKLRANLLQPGG